MKNEFTAIIEQDEDWYIAVCPEIPGANGQGQTRDEARASLAKAVALILEDRREEVFHDASPFSQDFWPSPTLDELAKSRNAQPAANMRALFGTWPGDEDDGFEAAIDELRHPGSKRSVRS